MSKEEVEAAPTQDPDNQVTDVDDSGISTEGGGMGGGGTIEQLFTGIGGAIDGWYARESTKKTLRGENPCHFFASIEELWYGNVGPKWWKAWGVARKSSMKLQRAITESIDKQGRTPLGSHYVTSTKLKTYLEDQVGEEALVPPGVFVLALMAGPLAPAIIDDFIKDRLPSGNDILNDRVERGEKGLQVSPGIYLWAPGLPTSPSNDTERHELSTQGKYGGPEFGELLDGWIEQQRNRVSPAGFLSARATLEKLVGNWEGSGAWGIWEEGDPVSPTSKIGFLDDFRVTMFEEEYDEAQALCEAQRQWERDQAEDVLDLAEKGLLLDASKAWGVAAALLVGAALVARR
jgi:hypothetical protein